jgi:hypothetical protein
LLAFRSLTLLRKPSMSTVNQLVPVRQEPP